jgi:indole-3-glycerol phosphate synthase
MTNTVPDILARIVDHKRAERSRACVPIHALEQQAEALRKDRRDFHAALLHPPAAIIGEIKKASPSKGLLSADFRPAESARRYERGGAAALSVLTDARFFQGNLGDLQCARTAVRIPVLRKDFTLDEYDVLEGSAGGADAILLIAALLHAADLRRLRELAESLGMAALVEVHDEVELESAIDSGARIIGVNNRDLRTFEVRLETSLRLAEKMPAGVVRVSESGIGSNEDVRRLRAAGYRAFLVGEHLMKAADPERALRELLA